MQVTEQTRKESVEILEIFKGRVLNPFKTEKWQNSLTHEISKLLSDFKMRERFDVGQQIQDQYKGFIPTPKATISNRLRFLFLGEIK